MKDSYLIKNIISETKDIDRVKNRVKIAIAHIGNIDKVGDMIDEKAFNKTIKDNPHKWHFVNHNPDLFVGKFEELYLENNNLIAVSNLGIENSNAKNLLTSYENGDITEHSIGYYVTKSKVIRDENSEFEVYDVQKNEFIKGYNLLQEIKLYEGSSLTVPAANPETPFLGFKSLENDVKIESINKLMTSINNSFSKKMTNEEFKILKIKQLQLNQLIKDYFEKKSTATVKTLQPNNIEKSEEKRNIYLFY